MKEKLKMLQEKASEAFREAKEIKLSLIHI